MHQSPRRAPTVRRSGSSASDWPRCGPCTCRIASAAWGAGSRGGLAGGGGPAGCGREGQQQRPRAGGGGA
eukprot:3702278-Lingulodinium_polyedra.AAC.1